MTARIAEVMSPHPITLNQWEKVARAREIFVEQGFTIVPLVDDDGRLVGIISATDLAVEVDEEEEAIDDKFLAEAMTERVFTAASTATVADAAVSMASHRIHHLVVVDLANRPVGVISTLDVAMALADSGLEEEVAALMTTEIVTVDIGTTVADALDILEDSTISAAVVQDGVGQYVGVLSRWALLTSDAEERVDQAMEPNIGYVEADATVSDVATAFAENGVRRLLVVDEHGQVQGIVTPSDLIRYAAGLAEYDVSELAGSRGADEDELELVPYEPEDGGDDDDEY